MRKWHPVSNDGWSMPWQGDHVVVITHSGDEHVLVWTARGWATPGDMKPVPYNPLLWRYMDEQEKEAERQSILHSG